MIETFHQNHLKQKSFPLFFFISMFCHRFYKINIYALEASPANEQKIEKFCVQDDEAKKNIIKNKNMRNDQSFWFKGVNSEECHFFTHLCQYFFLCRYLSQFFSYVFSLIHSNFLLYSLVFSFLHSL